MSIQYGLVTTPEIFEASNDLIKSTFEPADIERTNVHRSGGIYGTYRYFFIDKMSVSFTCGFTRTRGDITFGGEKAGESIRDFYTVGAEWNAHYLRFEHFQMYSGGGLALTVVYEDNSYEDVSLYSESGSKAYPNFHFTAVGVRFGSQTAFYLESGFGYKGIFCAGFSLQF